MEVHGGLPVLAKVVPSALAALLGAANASPTFVVPYLVAVVTSIAVTLLLFGNPPPLESS